MQKREKDGEQHLKEEEIRRRQKQRQQEAKVTSVDLTKLFFIAL